MKQADLIAELSAIVGADAVIDDEDELQPGDNSVIVWSPIDYCPSHSLSIVILILNL